jgi:hypothetical protein
MFNNLDSQSHKMALYSRFNYQLGSGGVVIPPDPEPTDVYSLKFAVSNVGNIAIVPADFKYNMEVAFAFGLDDNAPGAYVHGVPLFYGGVSGFDGQTYPGLRYSDGTGKSIPFRWNLVIPADSIKEVSQNSQISGNFDQVNDAVNKGSGISNHSWKHGGGPNNPIYYDRPNDFIQAQKIFYNRIGGYVPRVFTTPASEDGFMFTSRNLHGLVHNSTYNEGRSEVTIYGKIRSDQVPTTWFNLDRFYPDSDVYDADAAARYKGFIDSVFNLCDNGEKWFGNGFSHGIYNTNLQIVNEFFQYALNHPKNTGKRRLWVPSVQEFLEYFESKRLSTITHSISGGVMTVTIDQSNVPKNARWRDMSLLISGCTINSLIDKSGADDVTFNSSTGLVNFYKDDRTRSIDPTDPSQHSALITSVISSGNSVIVTFDRNVQHSSADGYSVNGLTLQGYSGNGKTWTFNFNGSTANKFLTYKSFEGNCITIDNGYRTGDYISYPIS